MSAHGLLNLTNKLKKIYIYCFCNAFYKFNNIRERMSTSICFIFQKKSLNSFFMAFGMKRCRYLSAGVIDVITGLGYKI